MDSLGFRNTSTTSLRDGSPTANLTTLSFLCQKLCGLQSPTPRQKEQGVTKEQRQSCQAPLSYVPLAGIFCPSNSGFQVRSSQNAA